MDEYVAFFGVIPNIWSKFKNAFESKIFSEKTVNKCQVQIIKKQKKSKPGMVGVDGSSITMHSAIMHDDGVISSLGAQRFIELFVHLWELQRPSACQDSETAGPRAGILILLAVGEILAGYALAVDIPVISG